MSNEIMLYGAFGFIIFLGLLNSFKVYYSISYLKKRYGLLASRMPSYYPNIFILMPVLRESGVIESAVENLSELKYPEEKLRIVVITTDREYELISSGPD